MDEVVYCCPKSIKGCALRVTRLDACGRPLDPLAPQSRVAIGSFISYDVSPDIETGTQIKTFDACGNICINDKDCDKLLGFNVTLTLCGLPFPLMEMIYGAIPLFGADATGALDPNLVMGGVLPDGASNCGPNTMLDIWGINADANACADGSFPFIQWTFPQVSNWQFNGDLSFSRDSESQISFSGYAEKNAAWSPSCPGPGLPSYDGTVATGLDPWVGAPDPILPAGAYVDPYLPWHVDAIRSGGPFAWACVPQLPVDLNNCGYMSAAA